MVSNESSVGISRTSPRELALLWNSELCGNLNRNRDNLVWTLPSSCLPIFNASLKVCTNHSASLLELIGDDMGYCKCAEPHDHLNPLGMGIHDYEIHAPTKWTSVVHMDALPQTSRPDARWQQVVYFLHSNMLNSCPPSFLSDNQ